MIKYKYDFFNNEGQYLYRVKIPEGITNIEIIKWGYVFSTSYNQETGYLQVKRYKIKNWDQIKTGCYTFQKEYMEKIHTVILRF